MPNLPRCAGAGLFQRMTPLTLAGTGFLTNSELGFPTGAGAITSAGRIDSNAILVAGLNSFMVRIVVNGATTLTFSHCDPFTDAILTTHTVTTGALAGVFTIGAFSTDTATTNSTGHVFHTIRIGLQGSGANRTLTSFDMWLGTR